MPDGSKRHHDPRLWIGTLVWDMATSMGMRPVGRHDRGRISTVTLYLGTKVKLVTGSTSQRHGRRPIAGGLITGEPSPNRGVTRQAKPS
jgi:hypothetical protein